MITQFISEARAYCERAGIKPSTLGQYAVRDNTLFDRLESGGQCLPRTMDRVRAYMESHPVQEHPAASPQIAPPTEDAA